MDISYADKVMAEYRWWRRMRGGVWERWIIEIRGEDRRYAYWYPVPDDARFRFPHKRPKGVTTVFPPLDIEDWRKGKTN